MIIELGAESATSSTGDARSDELLLDYARKTDAALRKDATVEAGIYLAESALVLERALKSGHRPRSVMALRTHVDVARDLVGPTVPIFTGDSADLAEITGYDLHRGLIGSLERPTLPSVPELLATSRRVVILEDVVDPTNVGAIFRSVAGIGADAVLVTASCSDPFYRRAIRVSMGTVLQVPWTRIGPWPEARGQLAAAGFDIAALALTDDACDLRDYARDARDSDRGVALVLGTEGTGLSQAAIDAADVVVQIPMRHGIDSLNVAATAAVAMWALA